MTHTQPQIEAHAEAAGCKIASMPGLVVITPPNGGLGETPEGATLEWRLHRIAFRHEDAECVIIVRKAWGSEVVGTEVVNGWCKTGIGNGG